MFELISEGGSFMWPLLVCAIVTMYVVVERFLYFQRIRINAGDLLLGLANLVKQKHYDEATQEAARAPGPVARVTHSLLMRHSAPRCDLRDIAGESVKAEIIDLEKNLRVLYGVVYLAPLVGILGTINGLIKTFSGMSRNTSISNEMLFEGLFESLLTTGIGVLLAIICYLFYGYFVSRATKQLHRIERAGIEMVNIIEDAKTVKNREENSKK